MQLDHINAGDGTRIAVRTLRAQAAAVPPVLFIHALAMDGSMWERVARAVRGPAALLAMDCRGHGQSGKPAGPYAMARFGQDVRDLLDALGHRSAVICGCSMGGMVAQSFAAQEPARTAALCLVDTTAWYGPEAPANWRTRAAKAREGGMAALVDFQLDRWFSPAFAQANPAVVKEAVDVFLANDTAAFAATCEMMGGTDMRQALARYRGPAAVLVGAGDYAAPPAMAEALAALLHDAGPHVIPEARHFTPYEAPEAIAWQLDALMVRAR